MPVKQRIIILAIGLFVFLADRLTKYIIWQKLRDQHGVFIIDIKNLIVKIEYFLNANLAFSLPLPQTLTIILIFVIIGLLVWFLYKKLLTRQFFYSLFLMMIIIAAISNLFDRLALGGVIDFISVKIFNLQWGIFNLADLFITAGIIALIILEIKTSKRPYEKSNTSNNSI